MDNLLKNIPFPLLWIGVGLVVLAFLLLVLLLITRARRPSPSQNTKTINRQTSPSSHNQGNLTEPTNIRWQLINDQGRVFSIQDLPLTIGRSEKNTITLESNSISEVHARLFFDPRINAVCIEDLGSLNGILVNGQPTRKNALLPGDKVRLGDVDLTFMSNTNNPFK